MMYQGVSVWHWNVTLNIPAGKVDDVVSSVFLSDGFNSKKFDFVFDVSLPFPLKLFISKHKRYYTR